MPPLCPPYWEHSFGLLNIPLAFFSRSLLHTFSLGWNFEHLTISGDYLGYRHAIGRWMPQLDSPHWELSFGQSNVAFAPFPKSFLHSFTLGQNFEPLTILQAILGYMHGIAKQIPRVNPSPPGNSLEPLNVPFAQFLGFSFSLFFI